MSLIPSIDLIQLSNNIKAWAKALGFQHVGISKLDTGKHKEYLQTWLDNNFQGEMAFFENNLDYRLNPDLLVPGSLRVISVAMQYLPESASFSDNLENPDSAYVSRYALGKDYHKLMRKRLKKLAEKIIQQYESLEFRPFVDSGPVLEHAFAEQAGIGWTGKHSLTLNHQSGSWFFLGELFVNIPLPTDTPMQEDCGSCQSCITICPTKAIIEPYTIDANRCISYLTIEYNGVIPVEFRTLMGNRIYGCDDCQLICPINQQAPTSSEQSYGDLYGLKNAKLVELFCWTESEFLERLEGSPIRRIGHMKWRRNISVAIANAPFDKKYIDVLTEALDTEQHPVLIEHLRWALHQQKDKQRASNSALENRQTARLTRSIRKGMPRDA